MEMYTIIEKNIFLPKQLTYDCCYLQMYILIYSDNGEGETDTNVFNIKDNLYTRLVNCV